MSAASLGERGARGTGSRRARARGSRRGARPRGSGGSRRRRGERVLVWDDARREDAARPQVLHRWMRGWSKFASDTTRQTWGVRPLHGVGGGEEASPRSCVSTTRAVLGNTGCLLDCWFSCWCARDSQIIVVLFRARFEQRAARPDEIHAARGRTVSPDLATLDARRHFDDVRLDRHDDPRRLRRPRHRRPRGARDAEIASPRGLRAHDRGPRPDPPAWWCRSPQGMRSPPERSRWRSPTPTAWARACPSTSSTR